MAKSRTPPSPHRIDVSHLRLCLTNRLQTVLQRHVLIESYWDEEGALPDVQGSQIQEDEGFKAQDYQYPLHGSHQEANEMLHGQSDGRQPPILEACQAEVAEGGRGALSRLLAELSSAGGRRAMRRGMEEVQATASPAAPGKLLQRGYQRRLGRWLAM
ncbi:hypothetical protein EYF80_046133 [Liparis tanakae]|uniref:Uncharacterized protein n=1 Tax=Liparis tanakae TaxID=230148 RepID=A0A4Z2FSH3_9TELE|nr:hypothetical protein EYF80_046133 [Liparis tanakae]